MATALNICLISREYPPDTAFGGIATFSRDTALMLKARGHRVTVFSQSLSASHVLDDHGVTVVKLKVPPPFGSYRVLPLFILAFNLVIIRAVMRHHRQQPFDLIDVPDHLAEGLFATFTRIPVVTRLHTPYALLVALGLNNYQAGLSYRLIKAMERLALRRSSIIYAPCMDLVRRCASLFGVPLTPVKIFGYPLDLELFTTAEESKTDQEPARILFLGRLEQRKGIETIVQAFPKLLEKHPGCTLTLVGSDTPNIFGFSSARRFIENALQTAGCLDKVSFKNPVPLEKLPGIFHAHHLIWVPSFYDNYPLICLEAMACGKVVVVSDAGGLPEMVEHGETGFVFPTGNAAALAEQSASILNNPELRHRIGRNARDDAQVNCSYAKIYQSTMELYHAVLDTQEPGGEK